MLKKLKKAITNPRIVLIVLLEKFACLFPDKWYLSMKYRLLMRKPMNWKNPQTFNEKLQWLKLYDRKPEYTQMVDKYEAKKFVANIIGEEYIIPTLGVWDRFDDIDFAALPEKFVLKTTHDSGTVAICTDKQHFDIAATRKLFNKRLRRKYYYSHREWPYKNVKPRIIAEKYMVDESGYELKDYKFFCFDGEPKYCQVIRDRYINETIDFYDMNWIHMPFVGLNPVIGNGLNPVIGNGLNPVTQPKCLENMKVICKKLSSKIPFVRIDLYVIQGKEYFGEITFYPASGIGTFTPSEWNRRLGDLIQLSKKS